MNDKPPQEPKTWIADSTKTFHVQEAVNTDAFPDLVEHAKANCRRMIWNNLVKDMINRGGDYVISVRHGQEADKPEAGMTLYWTEVTFAKVKAAELAEANFPP